MKIETRQSVYPVAESIAYGSLMVAVLIGLLPEGRG